MMNFKLNYSRLRLHVLQKNEILHSEIRKVYEGDASHTVWEPVLDYYQQGIYYYLIGFSSKSRFLQILLHCDGDEVHFLQVRVAYSIRVIVEDFFKKL